MSVLSYGFTILRGFDSFERSTFFLSLNGYAIGDLVLRTVGHYGKDHFILLSPLKCCSYFSGRRL